MKRFKLKRRVVVDGKLNPRAMKRADTSPVQLPDEAAKAAQNIPQNIPAPVPKAVREKPVPTFSSVDALNPREIKFIEHYMATGNGTAAAIAAGYSKKGADVAAVRLLGNAKISGEIRARKQAALARVDLTMDDIVAELKTVGLANMGNYMRPGPDGEPLLDFSNLSRAETAALREVTVEEFVDGRSDKRQVRRVKFRLHDKMAALELLGRHLGGFEQKHKHQVSAEGPLAALLDEIDQEARARSAKLINAVMEK